MDKHIVKGKRITNSNLVKLLVAVLFLTAYLLVNEQHAFGQTIHEWLGVGMLVAILVHALINWEWIVSVTKRMFKRLQFELRLKYLVDTLMLIGFAVVIFSGLMMSASVLPALGFSVDRSAVWRMVHNQATDFTLIILAIHLGLQWTWIVDLFNRTIGGLVQNYIHEKQRPA
jgi:hypothetical protein